MGRFKPLPSSSNRTDKALHEINTNKPICLKKEKNTNAEIFSQLPVQTKTSSQRTPNYRGDNNLEWTQRKGPQGKQKATRAHIYPDTNLGVIAVREN